MIKVRHIGGHTNHHIRILRTSNTSTGHTVHNRVHRKKPKKGFKTRVK